MHIINTNRNDVFGRTLKAGDVVKLHGLGCSFEAIVTEDYPSQQEIIQLVGIKLWSAENKEARPCPQP